MSMVFRGRESTSSQLEFSKSQLDSNGRQPRTGRLISIGYPLTMNTDLTMRLSMTLENGNEAEKPRDQKGYTWIPVDGQAKRDRKWIPMEDLTKKKEWTWIPVEG